MVVNMQQDSKTSAL